MNRHFIYVCLGLLVSLGLTSSVHAATSSTHFTAFAPAPDSFVSAIIMLPKTRQVLYAFKPQLPHPAASLTKLTNALAFTRLRVPLSRAVTLIAADEVGGGRLRVNVGARCFAQDLLYSSITASANNTANAMARVSRVSAKKYLATMNDEAKKAGATQSVFVDFSGMDPRNMTTAYDMALIAERAFRDYVIRRAATVASYQFSLRDGKKIIQKRITNTNYLLTQDPDVWVTGGKTGYLEEAGYNLVTRLRPLDKSGTSIPAQELMVVVLGAPTKEGSFASAKALAEWAWQQHEF